MAFCQPCPPAAICHTATKRNGTLVGRFRICAIPPISASDAAGQHDKTGGVSFGASLVHTLKALLSLNPALTYSLVLFQPLRTPTRADAAPSFSAGPGSCLAHRTGPAAPHREPRGSAPLIPPAARAQTRSPRPGSNRRRAQAARGTPSSARTCPSRPASPGHKQSAAPVGGLGERERGAGRRLRRETPGGSSMLRCN